MPQKLTGNTTPSTRRKLRNACFTLNNPDMEHSVLLDGLVHSQMTNYIVIGKEVGESGTPHFQGYVEFKQQVDFHLVLKWLPKAHIESRRGSAHQASIYCKKDGDFLEWGTLSRQGERSDIDELAQMVNNRASTLEIARTLPTQYIKFHRGVHALQSALTEARTEVPEVRVFHGTTGTGKSFQARQWLPNAYVWHPQQGTWFDGYQGQTSVIFEEFRGQIPFGMILSLLDRYCCKVQYKGGVTEFAAKYIAITSPVPPSDWYFALSDGDKLDQLHRRISEVIHCQAKDCAQQK